MSYARYTVVRLLYLNLMFFALINEGLKRKKLNWSIWTGLGKRQKTTENSQKMENASLFLLDCLYGPSAEKDLAYEQFTAVSVICGFKNIASF